MGELAVDLPLAVVVEPIPLLDHVLVDALAGIVKGEAVEGIGDKNAVGALGPDGGSAGAGHAVIGDIGQSAACQVEGALDVLLGIGDSAAVHVVKGEADAGAVAHARDGQRQRVAVTVTGLSQVVGNRLELGFHLVHVVDQCHIVLAARQ